MCNFAHLGPSTRFSSPSVFSKFGKVVRRESYGCWCRIVVGCCFSSVVCCCILANENRVCHVLKRSSLRKHRERSHAMRLRLGLSRLRAPRAGAPRVYIYGRAGGTLHASRCGRDCRGRRARARARWPSPRRASHPPRQGAKKSPVSHSYLLYSASLPYSHTHTHDSHACQLSHVEYITHGAAQTERKNAQCPSEHIMPRHPRLSRLSRSTESSPWRPCSRPARPSAGTAGGSPRRPRTSPRPPPPS